MRNVLLLALLVSLPLRAQDSAGWRLFGSNEIVLEDFGVSGDGSASPFPIEGTFITDRLGFTLGWGDGGRDLVIQAELLATDSEYLPEEGVVIGALSIRFENGAAAVPYRIEAGDLHADLSRRVLQRQIRGTMVEFQPAFGRGTHSLVLLYGSGMPDWENALDDGLAFTGASWLWQSPSQSTTLVASLTHESAEAGAEGVYPFPLVSLDRRVASLAARTAVAGFDLEGEWSILDGEAGEGEGASWYGEVARASERVQWRARYEDNDREYAPFGAMGVLPGRSTAEAQGRWLVSPRASLRARAQHVESRADLARSEATIDLAGLTFDARPLERRPGLTARLMADVNRIESDDASQDLTFENYGLEVQDQITNRHDLTWRTWYRTMDDEVLAASSRRSTDHELVAGRIIVLGRWRGRVGGGVAYRVQRGAGPVDSISPIAELNLTAGAHRLGLYYGYADQDFLGPEALDLVYQNRRAMYSFASGAHEMSLELGQELREPAARLDTEASRVAMRYRYSFSRTWR